MLFSQYLSFFLAPSDSRLVVLSQPMLTNGLEWCGLLVDYCDVFIILTNHTSMKAYLFGFQVMYKSQLKKKLPLRLFCSPGSHMIFKS